MTLDEGKEQSRAYGRQAVAALEAWNLSLTPRNYELAYTHFSGRMPGLSRELYDPSGALRTVSQTLLDDLYIRFVGQELDLDIVRQAGEQLHAVAARTLSGLAEANDSASEFGARLGHYSSELASQGTGHELRHIVVAMAEEAQRAHAQTALLEGRLSQAMTEVANLQEALVGAQQEALTDSLTGAGNRKALDHNLRVASREATETGRKFSLVLIDIDHFKKFNDAHGHQIGDQVIRLVARTLKDNTKGRDFVARHGGEEFALLLPDTGLSDAVIVADHVRSSLMRRRIVRKDAGADYGTITISLGVSQYRCGEPLTELVHRADSALYFAKAHGRNRVDSEECLVKQIA